MHRTLEAFVGNTPLVRLQRIPGATDNVILAKLEGNNPAGSVKDRPALSMVRRAQERGTIKPGDTLIEPTSGNTGIALAMAAASGSAWQPDDAGDEDLPATPYSHFHALRTCQDISVFIGLAVRP